MPAASYAAGMIMFGTTRSPYFLKNLYRGIRHTMYAGNMCNILLQMLVGTGVFNHFENELRIWIEQLTKVEESAKVGLLKVKIGKRSLI